MFLEHGDRVDVDGVLEDGDGRVHDVEAEGSRTPEDAKAEEVKENRYCGVLGDVRPWNLERWVGRRTHPSCRHRSQTLSRTLQNAAMNAELDPLGFAVASWSIRYPETVAPGEEGKLMLDSASRERWPVPG